MTSYGRTATVWLTYALNLHPDILCNHGPSTDLIQEDPDGKYSHEFVVHSQNNSRIFAASTLRNILDGISRNCAGKKYIGNVHGFTMWNLQEKNRGEEDAPPFDAVNLLRHPITRIHSFAKRWQAEASYHAPVTVWIDQEAMSQERYQRYLTAVQEKHDITIDSFADKAFFHAVMQASADHGDLQCEAQHIISERLVSDIDYFTYVFRLLMGNRLPVSSGYVEQVRTMQARNASEGSGKSAVRILEEWKPWQRTLFELFIKDHPTLRQRYQELGYDVLIA